ncbi:MAG: flagellar biosynthetic protein FliO [Clostridia bacterium]|nr:flagellar biosynthetic protein FliO [Clostridia bacterium]
MDWELLWSIIKLLVALPVVIAVTYWVIRYGLGAQFRGGYPSAGLRVIDRVMLTPKSFIAVVRVDKEYLVVAGGEKDINLIARLDHYPETSFSSPELLSSKVATSYNLVRRWFLKENR